MSVVKLGARAATHLEPAQTLIALVPGLSTRPEGHPRLFHGSGPLCPTPTSFPPSRCVSPSHLFVSAYFFEGGSTHLRESTSDGTACSEQARADPAEASLRAAAGADPWRNGVVESSGVVSRVGRS